MHSLNTAFKPAAASPNGLYTLEVTAKDIAQVEASKAEIPLATPINIAFLGNEDHAQRVNAARVIRQCGFEPVPIISARRLRSEQDCDSLLGALIGEANPMRFILVGGDPEIPAGPYGDSLALRTERTEPPPTPSTSSGPIPWRRTSLTTSLEPAAPVAG